MTSQHSGSVRVYISPAPNNGFGLLFRIAHTLRSNGFDVVLTREREPGPIFVDVERTSVENLTKIVQQIDQHAQIVTAPVASHIHTSFSAQRIRKLQEEILQGFTQQELERELLFCFDMKYSLEAVATGSSYTDVVFALIQWTERHSLTADLVRCLAKARPHNRVLRHILYDCGHPASNDHDPPEAE